LNIQIAELILRIGVYVWIIKKAGEFFVRKVCLKFFEEEVAVNRTADMY